MDPKQPSSESLTDITTATRIGWIGTGVMGQSMCGHLMSSGFKLTIFNRTKSRAEPLLKSGATWADAPNDVGKNSDVVFTMLGYPSDVEEIILGKNGDGLISSMKRGSVIVDMTTSRPELAVRIAEEGKKSGIEVIDAPVSGGDLGARNATLSLMIGGDESTFLRLMPLWSKIGKTIEYQGGAGSGQHCKLTNQILVSGVMVSICEAMLYAYRSGGDMKTILRSISSGAAGSWGLTNLAPRIVDNDFAPGFFVEHFVKDLGIVLEESNRMGLKLPGVELAEQLYRSLRDNGDGRLGTQALIRGLSSLNGIDWEHRT